MKYTIVLVCCGVLLSLGALADGGESMCRAELVLPLQVPLRLEDDSSPLKVATAMMVPAFDSEGIGCYICPTQFRVWIPDNAISFIFEVESDENEDDPVDLYVRYGMMITEDEDFVYFSAAAVGPDSLKRLELSGDSDPALQSGPLFIALGSVSETETPVIVRLSCVVSELPEGEESGEFGVWQIPLFVVNVSNLLNLSIPVGWVPLPDEDLSPTAVAVFESPHFENQPTAGNLEVSTWALSEVSDVEELQRRLEAIYEDRGGLKQVAQGELTIDGHNACKSLLIDESTSSGTLFACFIDEGAAWLISTTFAPLGYGEMYERIFELATASFRFLDDTSSASPSDEDPLPTEASLGPSAPLIDADPLVAGDAVSSWETMVTENVGPLSDIHCTPDGRVVAVSLFGAVLQLEGAQWVDLRDPSGRPLYATWICEKGTIFAVGSQGAVLCYDERGWTETRHPNVGDLYDLFFLPSGTAYAAGEGCCLLRFDGNRWDVIPIDLPEAITLHLDAIWAFSVDDVYVAGWDLFSNEGIVLHFDGGAWAREDVPTARELYSAWGTDRGELYVVGAPVGEDPGFLGTILYFDGTQWDELKTPVPAHVHLEGIWGVSGHEIYAVGNHGSLFAFDGTTWAQISLDKPMVSLASIWGTSSDEIYVVGSDGFRSLVLCSN